MISTILSSLVDVQEDSQPKDEDSILRLVNGLDDSMLRLTDGQEDIQPREEDSRANSGQPMKTSLAKEGGLLGKG